MPAEFKKRITLDEAFSLLQSFKSAPAQLALQPERAIGFFCAEEVRCRLSIPPLPVSMVDGYAVPSKDSSSFLIVQQTGPGEAGPSELQAGQALKVSTGSYLPKNSVCVVPLETARAEGNRLFVESFPDETNIMPAGYDCEKGEALCRPGDRITAAKAFFMKWAGVQVVRVFSRPKVSIIPIGSELVNGAVPNANPIALSELVQGMGAAPRVLDPVPDDVSAIAGAIAAEARESDVVLTTGGSSVGEKDLVADAVSALGGRVLFHGLKLRPGRTGGVAEVGGRPLIITSGNIQASVIETLLLLGKTLEAMGYPVSLRRAFAKVDSDFSVSGPEDFSYVVWLKLYNIQNELFGRAVEALSTSRRIVDRADGFTIIKGNSLKKNSVVEVYLL